MMQCTYKDCGFSTTSEDGMLSHVQEKHVNMLAIVKQAEDERSTLNRALEIAHKNGWRPTQFEAADIPYIDKTWRNIVYTIGFAQALWGVEEYSCMCAYEDGWCCHEDCLAEFEWQRHLREMIITDDPIKYLGVNTHA